MSAMLRLGTRASPLAMAQTLQVAELLRHAHPDLREEGALAVVPMTTTGDRLQQATLAELGGTKGLFTKELEDALLAGTIDAAVHSLKDMPTALPPGLMLAAVPVREDPRDVWIAADGRRPEDLRAGEVVATASLRRAAQVRHRWPALQVVPIRGNIQTRLRKLSEGAGAATMLALAGLRRAGISEGLLRTEAEDCTVGQPDGAWQGCGHVLDTDCMLPAVAQGALALEIRHNDPTTAHWLAALHHAPSAQAVTAERVLLAELDGSCRTPIAALAEYVHDGVQSASPGELLLRARVLSVDGRVCLDASRRGSAADAARLGHDAGAELRQRAAAAGLCLGV